MFHVPLHFQCIMFRMTKDCIPYQMAHMLHILVRLVSLGLFVFMHFLVSIECALSITILRLYYCHFRSRGQDPSESDAKVAPNHHHQMSACVRFSKIIPSSICTRSQISRKVVSSTALHSSRASRSRTYATYFPGESSASSPSFVKIVECGARDGLQNEPSIVDVQTKVELIERLGDAGLSIIESGSMVSKKGVPQVCPVLLLPLND